MIDLQNQPKPKKLEFKVIQMRMHQDYKDSIYK